jgi:hypothetical protein
MRYTYTVCCMDKRDHSTENTERAENKILQIICITHAQSQNNESET